MDSSAQEEVTRILSDLRDERLDRVQAINQLFDAAYPELERLACGAIRGDRAGQSMSAPELVNETYLRLIGDARVHWKGRAHFFGVAATAMRRILVEQARQNAAAKRGGGWRQVTLDDRISERGGSLLEILELDSALLRLRAVDPRGERVVELRVFAGMEVGEIAHVIQVSERTVHNDWRTARIWLARELSRGASQRRKLEG
jgi:RNA polymerase sigma factor (TIGR02999 family)